MRMANLLAEVASGELRYANLVGEMKPYGPGDELVDTSIRFLRALVEERDSQTALSLVSDELVSPDPHVHGKPELGAFAGYLKKTSAFSTVEVHGVTRDDDLVAVHHTDTHDGKPPVTLVDIFRHDDGLITEYWAVSG